MLTKNDLEQIRMIVKDEVQVETKPIKRKLSKISHDLNTVIVHFDNRITRLENDVKILQKN